jgi:hypothetical protein
MGLNGEITKFKILMGKYLIDEVMMGIYLNFSLKKMRSILQTCMLFSGLQAN